MKEQTGEQVFFTERVIKSIGAKRMEAVVFSCYMVSPSPDDAGQTLLMPVMRKDEKPLRFDSLNDLEGVMSGQQLLLSLCGLYHTVNDAAYSEKAQIIADWCSKNVHPYDIASVYGQFYQYKVLKACKAPAPEEADANDPMEELLSRQNRGMERKDLLQDALIKCCEVATFCVNDFIHDLNLLANAANLYHAMCALHFEKDDTFAQKLYHPDSDCDEGVPAFGLANQRIEVSKDSFRWLTDLFPKLAYTLQYDVKEEVVKLSPVQNSIFDVAWNTLAELAAATFGQKPYSPMSALRQCPVCGQYFIRKQSPQKYCGSSECEKIRKRMKSAKYAQKQRALAGADANGDADGSDE